MRNSELHSDPFFVERCRLDILLLINAPVGFVPWLAGLGCEATGIDQWRYPAKRWGKLYSTLQSTDIEQS